MTYEEAVPIVEACVQHGLKMHGLGGPEDPPSLREHSLAELVEAQRVVLDTEKAREKPDGQTRSFHTVCDDRLVAALYVAMNFPGSDPADADPICLVDGKIVVVIGLQADELNELEEAASAL